MLYGLVQTICELDMIDSRQEHRFDTSGISFVNMDVDNSTYLNALIFVLLFQANVN